MKSISPSIPCPLPQGTSPRGSRWVPGRRLLVAGALLVAILALLPVLGLVGEGLQGLRNGNAASAQTVSASCAEPSCFFWGLASQEVCSEP